MADQGPTTYIIYDADRLAAAKLGMCQARSRPEAVDVFADEQPAQVENKTLVAETMRNVKLGEEAAIHVTVETRPVVTKQKRLPSAPADEG